MSRPAPSLLQRGQDLYPRLWRWIGILALGGALALVGTAIGATVRARKLTAATATLASPEAYAARHEAAAAAALFGQPTLTAALAQAAGHLPPDIALAQASFDGAGILRLVIDTDDPDGLRAAFRGDAWLAQLHQRAEDQIGDGRFRLTFERRP